MSHTHAVPSLIRHFQGNIDANAARDAAERARLSACADHLQSEVIRSANQVWQSLKARTRAMLLIATNQREEQLKFSAQLNSMNRWANSNIPPLLFFYSSDKFTRDAQQRAALKVSAGVSNEQLQPGIHVGQFPPGLYGTDIAPWDLSQSQQQLADAFYGKEYAARAHPDLRYFVAFVPEVWHWQRCGYLNYPEFSGQVFWHWASPPRTPRAFQVQPQGNSNPLTFIPVHYAFRGKSLIPD